MPLQHQSNAQLLAHKVAHEVLDPALWFPVEEVERDEGFPETCRALQGGQRLCGAFAE